MESIFFILLIAGLFYILFYFIVIQKWKKQDKMLLKVKELEDFDIQHLSHEQMSFNGTNGIAIDEKRCKICLVSLVDDNVITKIYTYKDILEVEILEDGFSFSKTSRGSQIGGMLLGGITLGGVGAIIGGLSGSTNQVEKVKNITLKIVINDTRVPMFMLNILSFDNGVLKNSSTYINFMNTARRWHSLLSVLIKKADEEDEEKENSPNLVISVADEILKLKKLLNEKLLSEEEFEEQKNKLLNN